MRNVYVLKCLISLKDIVLKVGRVDYANVYTQFDIENLGYVFAFLGLSAANASTFQRGIE